MFPKNAWYCAGWDHDFNMIANRLVPREIAGELVMLYRKADGQMVAMEDRCPHRQAALSLGTKEGDGIRCGYHGMLFGPDGKCREIPGQTKIPERATVRIYPVVEKDGWVWVWMGDATKVDPALIPFAVGPHEPGWVLKTDYMPVNTNYRLEIANLMDLSHLTWIHKATLGGTDAYTNAKVKSTVLERGVRNEFVVRGLPLPAFAQHLFPKGMLIDIDYHVTCTIPCTWVLHFRAYTAGTATEGPPNGQLILDTWSGQAVTPRNEDWVDYYFSWGTSVETTIRGLPETLIEGARLAFLEDKAVLEAQWKRMKNNPGGNRISIANDAAGNKTLAVLDKILAAEAAAARAA